MTERVPVNAAPGEGLVPGWLERVAAVGWRLLAAIALGVVLIRIAVALSTVTISILVAAIVAATFAPFVLNLRERGWSRLKSAAAVFLGAGVVILAILAIIAIAFIPYVAATLTAIRTGLTAVESRLAEVNVPEPVSLVIHRVTEGLQSWVSAGVSEIAGDVGTIATVAILGTFLSFFFLMDGDKAWVWVVSSTSRWRRDTIDEAGDDALGRVGGYLRGTAVIAAFDGLAAWIFMVVLGVPHAAPLAVIVFLGRFIPYVGGLFTTILIVIVALGSVGSTAAIVLFVLMGIVTFVQGKFLAPVIYHRTVHIHPAIALIALPAGAALGGIVGLFIAIPVVAFALAIASAVIAVLGAAPDALVVRNPLVPVWLDRLGQVSWRMLVAIALLGVLVAAAVQVPIVVLPLVLGIVLAATLAPVVGWLEARGRSHSRAVLATTIGGTFGVIAIVVLTLVAVAGPASDMIDQAVAGAASANDSSGGNAGPLITLVQAFGVGVLGAIAGILSGLASLGVILLLAVLLMYYFLEDGASFWRTFLDRIEPSRQPLIADAGGRAFSVLGGYMIGTGAISVFGAATQFLIMTILGIPLALPLAVLAVFGGFIPYIGSLVTTGLAFLVTVATGSPQDIAIMAIFTIVFNIVQGNFVAPIVYSRVVSLHPAVVLAAIPAGNAVAGIVGMFLVVPFLGVVAASWRTVLRVLDTRPLDATEQAAADPDTVAQDPALSTAPST